MPNAKKVATLTDKREAEIQDGIACDPDSREASDKQFARLRPVAEALPASLYAALVRPRGRPKAVETKQAVKLRLDRKAVDAFKRSGPGWQTRMNDVIVRAAKSLEGRALAGPNEKTTMGAATKSAAVKASPR